MSLIYLTETLKHMAGMHNQKRHGWRFGSISAAKRSMTGIDKAERDEYKKRARAKAAKSPANFKTKPGVTPYDEKAVAGFLFKPAADKFYDADGKLDDDLTSGKEIAPAGMPGTVDDMTLKHWDSSTTTYTPSIPNSVRAANKAAIVDELAKRTGFDKEVVNDGIRQWALTSNDEAYAALEFQKAAADEFGVPLSQWQQGKLDAKTNIRNQTLKLSADGFMVSGGPADTSVFERIPGELKPGIKAANSEEASRKFVRAMHQNTQEQFKAAGIKQVTLYRGVNLSKEPALFNSLTKGENVNLKGNALESWSTHSSIAKGFTGGQGAVFSITVPVERIVGTAATGFGCLSEYEMVVLGGDMGQGKVETIINW